MSLDTAQLVDDILEQLSGIDAVVKGGRILAHITVKVHIISIRVYAEERALHFKGVVVLTQPLEELEDVGITRVEGAVVVVVPAEIEKTLCHLSAVASIVILITAIRGKTAKEEFSLTQLKVVWRVHHNPIVPPVMVAERLTLDNLRVLLQFLGKAVYLGIYILITEAYVAQSLEVSVA